MKGYVTYGRYQCLHTISHVGISTVNPYRGQGSSQDWSGGGGPKVPNVRVVGRV